MFSSGSKFVLIPSWAGLLLSANPTQPSLEASPFRRAWCLAAWLAGPINQYQTFLLRLNWTNWLCRWRPAPDSHPGWECGLESRGYITSLTDLKTLLVLSQVDLVRSYCCWSWRLLWRLRGCGGWRWAGECYETPHTPVTLRGENFIK